MYLHVYSGLASRCMALVGAHHLMKIGLGGEKLTVIWPKCFDCNISFYDCFDKDIFSDINFELIEIDYKGSDYEVGQLKDTSEYIKTLDIKNCYNKIKLITQSRLYKKKEYRIYNRYKKLGQLLDADDEKNQSMFFPHWWPIITEQYAGKEFYMRHFKNCVHDELEWQKVSFDCLKFNSKYVDRAEQIIKENNIIGVHIRRTDNINSINTSTTEGFVKAMETAVGDNSDVRFYLATDDDEIIAEMKKTFGDRIITMENRALGRHSQEAMGDAVVEMLCLSRCQSILGSFYSTFSRLPAQMSDIPITIVK